MTLTSISSYHYWYIVNETICEINFTSGSWDWSNQTLILSWNRGHTRRYSAKIFLPRLYNTLVSATIIPRLHCGNWKLRLQGNFSLSFCYKNFIIYFQIALLYVKVISNIVSGNSSWARRTKMSSKLSQDIYYPVGYITFWGRPMDVQ